MDILIAGDFVPSVRVAKLIKEKRFGEVFPEDLRDLIHSTDFSFVNFESPVIEKGYKPIPKCGPNLGCTEEAVEAVKYAGFTGVTMANNHIFDFGAEGLGRSVECCQRRGLDVVGVGENLRDATKVLYLEKGSEILAIINCCEHEFSIASETSAGANPLNPISQYYAIQAAKTKADYIVIIVHGGHEYYQLPSPRMQETYRFFIDAGADAVVNHHQHCYSGYEVYNGKPIFYGLGNFCFDTSLCVSHTWHEGYMVQIEFESEKLSFTLHPYIQCKEEASVSVINDRIAFDKKIRELNAILLDSTRLRLEVDDYYQSATKSFLTMYQPYENRILNKLYRMHLLPSFVSKRKILQIINYLSCEAHRDRQLKALQKIFE